jgi:hypothetical protein
MKTIAITMLLLSAASVTTRATSIGLTLALLAGVATVVVRFLRGDSKRRVA